MSQVLLGIRVGTRLHASFGSGIRKEEIFFTKSPGANSDTVLPQSSFVSDQNLRTPRDKTTDFPTEL